MGRHSQTGGQRPILVDAIGVFVILLAAGVATTMSPGHPLRALLTIAAFLFVPGYALTLLVFPAAERASTGATGVFSLEGDASDGGPAALTVTNRLALAVGLSIVLLPLFAMVIALSSFTYASPMVVSVVMAFTFPVLAAGIVRRARVSHRASYTPGSDVSDLVSRWFGRHDGIDLGLNVALALAILLTVGILTFAVVAPQDGTAYTQVSLLTADAEGDLAASGYPTNVTRDQPSELVLSVENREDESMEYTVIVQAQTVDGGTVVTVRRLELLETTVPENETRRVPHEVTLSRTGASQRVAYLLYRGDAPTDPTMANAYRTVYFWTNVSATDTP
jgi:uncharacterized membrane protein